MLSFDVSSIGIPVLLLLLFVAVLANVLNGGINSMGRLNALKKQLDVYESLVELAKNEEEEHIAESLRLLIFHKASRYADIKITGITDWGAKFLTFVSLAAGILSAIYAVYFCVTGEPIACITMASTAFAFIWIGLAPFLDLRGF